MTGPPSAAIQRRFATAALIGVVTYVVADVVLQLLPPHYSVIRDAESNLAVGPFGWIMNLNFLGRAATTLCAVGALARTGPASVLRRTGLVFLCIGGACSAALAFLPTDVFAADGSGLRVYTAQGVAHLCFAGIGFVAALGAIGVLTVWLRTRQELEGAYRAAVSLTAVAAFGLLSLALAIAFAPDLLGLAERICLTGILGWVFVVCIVLRSGGAHR